MQSDCAEHFSLLKYRAQGSPTSQQFRLSFRYVFASYLLKSPEESNCEDYEDDEVLSENCRKNKFILKQSERRKRGLNAAILDAASEDDISESDDFESDGEDSNDEDRLSYEMNEYFKSLTDLEYNQNSENAVVLMAGWAIKKIILTENCDGCKSMLEFHMDRIEPGVDLDETL